MQDWAQRIIAGDERALARAATGIENGDAEALALLRELAPRAGRAAVIGVTGAPGAGKSTLVDAMARELRREGRTVGILAVDPTSRVTGGAILGDRIRMQAHYADAGIFIRSMATRGSLGGLSRATSGLVTLLDAAGRDYIIIETVGVGQAEVEIAGLAQVTVVVLVPGMGDDIQALKAGIMEIADIFVINKADHAGVERVEREVQTMLKMGHRPDNWEPPVIRTVATEGSGVSELLESIRRFPGPRPPAPDPRPSTPVPQLDHLGIAVRSLDESLGFWESALGLSVSLRETVEREAVNVAMLPLGAPRIELLEAMGPDSVVAKFIEKRGPGLHHVALRVPDLEAAVERLRAAGARLLGEPRIGAGGHRYVFVHPGSAGGVLLELIQEDRS